MALKFTLKQVLQGIVESVQDEITQIPDFDAGTIRLTFNPLCEEAEEWLGGFSFDGNKCESEFIFPVKPGASHIREANWRGRHVGMVNCYGYSALKVAGASYALRHELGNCSEDAKFKPWIDGLCDEEHGFTTCMGDICYEIDSALWFKSNPDDFILKPFLRLHVCVSGADSEEDKKCALAAKKFLEKWCRSEERPLTPRYKRQHLFLRKRPEE